MPAPSPAIIPIRFPRALWRAVQVAARQQGLTGAALIRSLAALEVARVRGYRRAA